MSKLPTEPTIFRWPTRAELRWAALAAAAIMVFTGLPYLLGAGLTLPGGYYSGFLGNPDDGNVYLSLMRQARDGSWLFSDLFTSEPQRGLVLNVLWLKLGLLARLTHLSLPVTYHVARLLSGWMLLMAVYCLAAQVLSSLTWRRVALLLMALASGFGWLFRPGPGQPNPIDFGPGLVMPEAITFLSLLLNPLFASSLFLLLVTYLAAAHAFATGSLRAALLAGFAALFLGNIHTYDVIPLALILTAYLIYLLATRRAGGRAVLLALLIAAVAAPSVFYQLWLQRSGEIAVLVKATNQYPTPELPYVILGFGLPLLLALFGLLRAARGRSDWARLLVFWFVLGFAVIYLPVGFARKLIEGLHIPICLLATLALAGWFEAAHASEDKRRRRLATLTAAGLILLSFPSNLFFLTRGVYDLMTNNVAQAGNLAPPLYLSADQRAALTYLNDHAARADLVLANSRLANFIPALSGAKVYWGHWSETPQFADKIGEFSTFLRASTSDAARETFVRERGITYVVLDGTPIASDASFDGIFLPPGQPPFDPSFAIWLEPVFSQGRVSIYRVKDTGLA